MPMRNKMNSTTKQTQQRTREWERLSYKCTHTVHLFYSNGCIIYDAVYEVWSRNARTKSYYSHTPKKEEKKRQMYLYENGTHSHTHELRVSFQTDSAISFNRSEFHRKYLRLAPVSRRRTLCPCPLLQRERNTEYTIRKQWTCYG